LPNNNESATGILSKKFWDLNTPVRFAEKLWLKVLFTDLLWEKNIISTKKQTEKYELKDKRTGPVYLWQVPSVQVQSARLVLVPYVASPSFF
jgi:hypothetical protein